MRLNSKQSLYESFMNNLNEKIEQKYEKSNRDYNRFMKEVKQYTGSYTYLFSGKVQTECDGDPITVNYFHYERPYGENTYKTVVNVLTPLGRDGEYIQEEIEKELQPSPTRLSSTIESLSVTLVSSITSIGVSELVFPLHAENIPTVDTTLAINNNFFRLFFIIFSPLL